jgi:hypothetical protein
MEAPDADTKVSVPAQMQSLGKLTSLPRLSAFFRR